MKDRGFRIGKVFVENPIILAPMAGVTDYPFRKIAAGYEPGLICAEMVSAKGLVYGDQRTESMVQHHNRGVPLSQQLFGKDPAIMAEAAVKLEQLGVDIIDVNMGCPAPKIVKNGEGAALMAKPELSQDIIRQVVDAVNIPVTVKIRKGFYKAEEGQNALKLAAAFQDLGVRGLTIHGRTREQKYAGQADWEIISRLKAALSIPVIGNGDVFKPRDAKAMMEGTHCDGVMLGRGAMGAPWFLYRARELVTRDKHINPPDSTERIQVAKTHYQLALEYYGEKLGVIEMRKHLAWYLKGLPHSTKAKEKIMREKNPEAILKILQNFLEDS